MSGMTYDRVRVSALKRIVLLFLWLAISTTASAEWDSYLSTDNKIGLKEGFAFSKWTILSPSLNWPADKIDAALVAGCNNKGEKSLYVRMLPKYPVTDATQKVAVVEGQIKWDSSNSYVVPFVYDSTLNALRLQYGLDDSFSLINDGKKVTIQVPWHDGHQAVFEFSLRGSSEALRTAFDFCRSEFIAQAEHG